MEQSNDPQAVVEALAEHEEALSALYSAYAEQYPDLKGLWQTMSQEEHAHGKQLRALIERVTDLQPFVDARRYRLDDIRADTRQLLSVVQVASVAGFPLQEAFRTAVRLEGSLIESEVLAEHEGDPPEVAAVLGSLKQQTERHRRRLSESLAISVPRD